MTEAAERSGRSRGWANWLPAVGAILLSCLGAAFIYSACSVRTGAPSLLWWGHIRFLLVGTCLLVGLALVDYKGLLKWSPLVYTGILVLLVCVLLFGTETMGARRWVFGIQPSELAKIAVILLLADLLGRYPALRGFKGLLLTAAVAGVPTLLILVQPDLGTALVLAPTVFAMLFVANVAPRILWPLVSVAALAIAFELIAVQVAETGNLPPERRELLVKATGLRPHQYRRVMVFLFPDRDIHGAGYNKRQSEIAVGSGGAWGKGWGKGTQNGLGYLPPSVSANDFIFPVIAEELGYAGSCLLLALYLPVLLLPGVWIGCRCPDNSGKLLAAGITTLIFSHVFINICMTIGLLPITGLPLPFVSYGGTFMIVMMAAVGLLESISRHSRQNRTRPERH